MLVEGWTREYAAGGFWRGGKTIDVNWVEPAAGERTRNEGIWSANVRNRGEEDDGNLREVVREKER